MDERARGGREEAMMFAQAIVTVRWCTPSTEKPSVKEKSPNKVFRPELVPFTFWSARFFPSFHFSSCNITCVTVNSSSHVL